MSLISLLAAQALAQEVQNGIAPELNAQRFVPTLDGSRTLWVNDARNQEDGLFGRVLLDYVSNPLVYIDNSGEETGIVTGIAQSDVLAGYRFGPASVGVHLPVLLRGLSDLEGNGGTGLGDVAAAGKLTLVDPARAPIGLALGSRLSLPTATVSGSFGSRSATFEADLIAEIPIGHLSLLADAGVAAVPGVELENVALKNRVDVGAAATYALDANTGMALELNADLNLPDPSNSAGLPLEWMADGYRRFGRGLLVRGGVGSGLTPGVGSPEWRAVVGIGWEKGPRASEPAPVEAVVELPPDADRDGFLDHGDACPFQAEDFDQYEDGDGCPEQTPITVTVMDPSGQIAPSAQGTLMTPGGERSFVGTLSDSAWPGSYRVRATASGFEPGETEIVVRDGGPMSYVVSLKPLSRVSVSDGKIDLREKVFFATAKATILPESFSLLDEVARVLVAHPEIRKVRVEGHTDSQGPDLYNLDLSQRRAASVREYLVSKGVAPERISSEGYGETRPLDPSENAAAWEKNRRVEISILEMAPAE